MRTPSSLHQALARPFVRRALARPLRLVPLALLLLGACSDTVAPGAVVSAPGENFTIGTLQVRATTTIVGAPASNGPARLRTVVTLSNHGAWPLELSLPACALRVTGHRLAERTDAAAFAYPGTPPFADVGVLCLPYLVTVTVPPGGAHELVATADLAALRGSVPAGRWFLLAEVSIDAERSATVRVWAGDVTL